MNLIIGCNEVAPKLKYGKSLEMNQYRISASVPKLFQGLSEKSISKIFSHLCISLTFYVNILALSGEYSLQTSCMVGVGAKPSRWQNTCNVFV
ncbi:MAG: hypothetical protein CL600_14765 [Alteromonas sp.]|nr:hypothetical protein [Alteromonas sp.]